MVLLFPRLVVLRALVSLTTHLVREVYHQALLITAEMEEQAMSWLQMQLGFETAPPLHLPDQAAAGAAAQTQLATPPAAPIPPYGLGHHRPVDLEPSPRTWGGGDPSPPVSSAVFEGGLLEGMDCMPVFVECS